MAGFTAPWDTALQSGITGQGELSIGRTYPSVQQSAPVPSAAQAAPPEAGEGPDYADHEEFGVPGLAASYIDQTPYEPPGVGPSVPWDAPPWQTNQARGIDHGAPAFFNHDIPPDTGRMTTRDIPVGSFAWGITTDTLGRKVLANIGRPEHDIYQGVQRDNSPHWIDYEERPLYSNIAVPAPYLASEQPSELVPSAAYPDLSRYNFAAVNYASPPDPAQAVPGQAPQAAFEPQGDWE